MQEQSGEQFNFVRFLSGFSSPEFAKISAAALRIFLVRSRAPETHISLISCNLFDFFYSISGFLLPGRLPGDPRPSPNEKSRNSHLLGGPKTLIGQDLTNFYLTQSLGLHLFKRPAIYAGNVMKKSPPDTRKESFPFVLVTESIDSLSMKHIPSVQW